MGLPASVCTSAALQLTVEAQGTGVQAVGCMIGSWMRVGTFVVASERGRVGDHRVEN
jgi:hypothetical protein